MIITDITAENILKYSRLELHDLPESGLIAIDGPNESGKSSIGEAICFALFGRTFSLGPDELEKLIRWGENHCSARLRFRVGDGEHYEVARFLYHDGSQGVNLHPVGAEDEPIARGIGPVDEALYGLLGYGYDEFIESFYLAQREITTPHPHSHAIKTMAGITSLESLSHEFEKEMESEGKAIEETKRQIADLDREKDELDIKQGHLEALETERDEMVKSGLALVAEVEALEGASAAYQDTVPRIEAAQKGRGRAKFLRFVSFVFALFLFVGWGLLARVPEYGLSQSIDALLSAQIPQWDAQYLPWLIYAGAGSGLLYFLFWWRVVVLNGRLSTLHEIPRQLAAMLNSTRGQRQEQVDDDLPESQELVADADVESDQQGRMGLPRGMERPENRELSLVIARIAIAKSDPSEAREAAAGELAWMRSGIRKNQDDAGRLEQDIWKEKECLKKATNLNQAKAGLEENVAGLQHRIYLRELAQELLAGASGDLSQHFNRDLRELVGRTLPLFTEERYEHLQIDDDLTVRVFSNEKRGFMELEEISSGTQRQIMLAVRLALSQELTNSSVDGKQFVFLDEPFAFFDQERTRNAIRVLPGLSDEITQIWLVAQEFPGDQTFDVPIACSREQDALPAL